MTATDRDPNVYYARSIPAAAASLAEVRDWFNELEVAKNENMRCVELTETSARCELTPRYRNPNGAVNGGLIASFIDHAGGALIGSLVRPPDYAATADLTIRYLRPAMGGPIVARSRLIRRGRNIIVVGIDISDDTGRECAIATGAWGVIHDGNPAGPA